MKYELQRNEDGELTLTLEMKFKSIEAACDVLSYAERFSLSSLTAQEQKLVSHFKNNDLIGAVKLHRELTGWGLKESKEFCDALKEKLIKLQIISVNGKS